jgi:DNA primase
LLERVPAGAYRELLLDRLAEAIGVSAERFLTIVGPMNTSHGPVPGNAVAGSTEPAKRRARTAHSTGRGGLVRQAVQNLLHFPAIAARLTDADRQALDAVDEPGIEVLRELLDTLQGQPALHTAQLLERWRDQPLGERLARLAAERSLLADDKAAGDEMVTAVQKLAQGTAEAELDALIQKERKEGLDASERARLRELLSARHRG